ncbi:MAG: type VI secretion system baseplate subunit TssF [Ectothiorhodospiraceae bacterium]|nr:type VI secretion system baseplate subunit TssF [Ectothiorhodospiraceae bacterium]
MDDEILSYYNRELAYLRQMGAEFAEKHPKIAGRLRLEKDVVEDPHVSRLIESFAFLTARIRHQLDQGFPEVTQALMGVLYPDFHAPMPSFSILQVNPRPTRLETHRLPRGTELYTASNPHGTCYYRTCSDAEILPLKVAEARFSPRPFRAPSLPCGPAGEEHQAVLQLKLEAFQGTTLAELRPDRLRFFLNGQPQLSFRLYEFLLRHSSAIAIARHPLDPEPVVLGREHLRACGFGDSEAALPEDGRSSSGHRLLMEYFAFPEKFLFIELSSLEEPLRGFEETATIYIYFDRSHPELIQGVGPDSLLLGCTPIVNLFGRRLEPLDASALGHETRLSVDAGQAGFADIHTLQSLHARSADGETVPLQPFYGSHRNGAGSKPQPFWTVRREHSHWQNGRPSPGVDTYLGLVDQDFRITAPEAGWSISGQALCTNRDLPDKLPFGPGLPLMQFMEGGSGMLLRCVTAPTPSRRPTLGHATRRHLASSISLQHLTGEDGLEVLKQTLKLHDFRQDADARSVIDGMTAMQTRLTTARIRRDGRAALCPGTEIRLELDESRYSGSGLFLFTAVLNRFLAQLCTVNTFTRLAVHLRQQPNNEILWPPSSGEQSLI